MTFKRRNSSHNKHGCGHFKFILCSNCKKCRLKDKAIQSFFGEECRGTSYGEERSRDLRLQHLYSSQAVCKSIVCLVKFIPLL
ncbi:hypothetical protein VitviT2T_018618 [Vitis vinifera]|uniref:40S ribosomal protein S26 n=1 Tax=Vitis vinifera TaxID=29760 RepID=A0ABY9CZW1_VITVI|nr:hypothetical protein VitviT2T_018618 [Vitis vinifera]